MIKKRQLLIYLSFLLAFIVRLYFSLYLHPLKNYLFSDMQSYFDIAQKIYIRDLSSANIFYPPGLPLILTFFSYLFVKHALDCLAVFNSLLSALSIVFLYYTAKPVLNRKLLILFVLIMIFYYPQIDYTGYLLTETIALFFLTLVVFLCLYRFGRTKINYYLLGFLVGLSSLFRTNLIVTGIIIIIWAIYCFRSPLFDKIKMSIVVFLGFFLSILISLVVYKYVSGSYSLLPLNGGLNFMQGQCLIGHATDSKGWSFAPPVFMQRNIQTGKSFPEPFLNSNYYYQEGLHCLLHQPNRLLEKITENFFMFFGNSAWPSANQPVFYIFMNISHILFNLFVLPGIFLSVLFWKEIVPGSRNRIVLILLVIISSLITSTLYYADIRYRIPYDGFYILLSLLGFQSLTKKLRFKRYLG